MAVAGHPTEPMVFYFGGTGGVWKTVDGGTYWENITDGFFKTSAVGAMAVAESDPNVIYVGMGESCVAVPRLHWTSRADGVYRSRDGGKTWTNVGLRTTQHIARIRVHPHDPDLVYVAALGRLEEPHKDRGVYRSKDGGETWEQVLFKSDQAGAIDLSMDPSNPRIIYACVWQVRRSFWNSYTGGPDSGLYKTTDGGDTWAELTNNPGMPTGVKGRISVAVSPARPERVWVLAEGEDGGLFRSEDGGARWERFWGDPEVYHYDRENLTNRAHYYNHLFADPLDPDTVYVLNPRILKSPDGGRTFTEISAPHADHHDLWIDPRNPQRMINGNDGGACVTFNGGVSWSNIYNQPTGEFYHVATDTRFPYRVYGTQQDSSAIAVPSRSSKGAILWSDSYTVGSSESGQIAVRPDNPDIVYSGAIGSFPGNGPIMIRYNHGNAEFRNITVWPDALGYTTEGRKYRFQWDYPIVVSPHDPNVLYCAGNVVFRSTDEGSSWEVISPDLTRNDLAEREPFDPLTDIATFERCTISRFAESPLVRGLFWTGADDGLIHISRDGGKTWRNVTPDGLPEWSPVSSIDPSPHEPGAAYVAFNRYHHGDYRPHLYKTHDYGKTWQKITEGIPDTDFTRVLREDPGQRGLLYAGTEGGVYVSFDDGVSWQPFQQNFPPVPVHAMLVKEGDLVVATHGRGFWILDDLTPLHQLTAQVAGAPGHLFRPRPTYRFQVEPNAYAEPSPGPAKHYWLSLGLPATFRVSETPEGATYRTFLDAGRNPPDGVVVTYHLKREPEGEVGLAFLDSGGKLIKGFTGEAPGAKAPADDARDPRVPARPGANRFVWDMRYPGARKAPGEKKAKRVSLGPLAPPGSYRVRLTVGGRTYEQPFEIVMDPRIPATNKDMEAQLALLLRMRDKLSETYEAVEQMRRVRDQVEAWVRRAGDRPGSDEVSRSARALSEKLTDLEDPLIERPGRPWVVRRARAALKVRKLAGRLIDLAETVAVSCTAPNRQSYEVFDEISAEADRRLTGLKDVMTKDLAAFNRLVSRLKLPAVSS